MTKPLEPDEEATAALLERAGLARAQSRVFVALARGGGHAALDLSAASGLTRQAAADAANALELAGLARVERVASGGRPTNRYQLARDLAGAVAALVEARRAALLQEQAALDALLAKFT